VPTVVAARIAVVGIAAAVAFALVADTALVAAYKGWVRELVRAAAAAYLVRQTGIPAASYSQESEEDARDVAVGSAAVGMLVSCLG